jgi:cell fate (sporulation/competence/biofilm development) regulator YmcA (YheA/YmcA/DUF963 family)
MFDDGDISEQGVKDTIESMGGDIYQKAENIIKYIRSLDAESKALKAEAAHFIDRAKVCTNRKDSLKAYLKDFMEFSQIKKMQAGLFKLSLAKTPAKLEIAEGTEIPSIYLIEQPTKLDKRELLFDIKMGVKIDGVTTTIGTSLRIK